MNVHLHYEALYKDTTKATRNLCYISNNCMTKIRLITGKMRCIKIRDV